MKNDILKGFRMNNVMQIPNEGEEIDDLEFMKRYLSGDKLRDMEQFQKVMEFAEECKRRISSENIHEKDYTYDLVDAISDNPLCHKYINQEFDKNKTLYLSKYNDSRIKNDKRFKKASLLKENIAMKALGIVEAAKDETCRKLTALYSIVSHGWKNITRIVENSDIVDLCEIFKSGGKNIPVWDTRIHRVIVTFYLCDVNEKQLEEGPEYYVSVYSALHEKENSENEIISQLTPDRDIVRDIKKIVGGAEGYVSGDIDISFIRKYDDENAMFRKLMYSFGLEPEIVNGASLSSQDIAKLCMIIAENDMDVFEGDQFTFMVIIGLLCKAYQQAKKDFWTIENTSLLNDIAQMEQISSQRERYESENKRLEEELEKTKRELTAAKELIKEKERNEIAFKRIQKEEKQRINEKKELEALRTMVFLEEKNYTISDSSMNDATYEEDLNLVKSKKITIIGGNTNWQKHMAKILPDAKYIGAEQVNTDVSILLSGDIIAFHVKTACHSMYNKVTANLQERNNLVMLNTTNERLSIHKLAEGIRNQGF